MKKEVNADFRAGAKAMFDLFLYKAANNYHGNPQTQKICDIENRLLEEVAEDALESVDEFAYDEWKSITALLKENRLLKEEIQKLK